MTTAERLIIWPIGIALLMLGAALYALWSVAQSCAAFVDRVRSQP